MIILDTNVVSVLMGTSPDVHVAAWLSRQDAGSIYLTAVTRAEVRYGIARLPTGRRRDVYQQAADRLFDSQLDHTLVFDAGAADAYGRIVAERELRGRPIGLADAQIAAIAQVHQASVASRDTGGFDLTGISVIDPFVTGPATG